MGRYGLNLPPGGDFTIAWTEPPTDGGSNPLRGIYRDPVGLGVVFERRDDPNPSPPTVESMTRVALLIGDKWDEAAARGDHDAAWEYEQKCRGIWHWLEYESGSTSEARSATPETPSSLLKDEESEMQATSGFQSSSLPRRLLMPTSLISEFEASSWTLKGQESKTQATSGLQPSALPFHLLMPTRSFSESETNCWALKDQQSETTATTALQTSGLTSRYLMPGSSFPGLQQSLSEGTIDTYQTGVPLGLSILSNSHNQSQQEDTYCDKPRRKRVTKRGSKGITSYGKKMVRSGVTLLEEKHGRSRLGFLTLTVPTLSPEKYPEMVRLWPESLRQYKQELSRELQRHGLDSNLVYSTEIQEKRFWRYGVALPHAHVVFQARAKGKHYPISTQWYANAWGRILSNLLDCPVDTSAATRIERPRKSVAAYLSKYMSKGGKELEKIKATGDDVVLPSSWWGMTNELRREVKQKTIVKSLSRVDFGILFQAIQALPYTIYVKEYILPDCGRTVALYGRVEAAKREEFARTIEELVNVLWGNKTAM